jgi:hypothetical protein
LIPEKWTSLYGGAIAQLGERLLCTQEVVGSIPSGSTNFAGKLLPQTQVFDESSRELRADSFLLFNNSDQVLMSKVGESFFMIHTI